MLLENRQRPEDVFLNHVNDKVEMRNDYCRHTVLIIKIIIELLQVSLSVILFFHLLRIIIEIQLIGACLQLLKKLISRLICFYLNYLGRCLGSGTLPAVVVPVTLLPWTGLLVATLVLGGILLIKFKTNRLINYFQK